MPANPFETAVGYFGSTGMRDTRDYMRARCAVYHAQMRINTKVAAQAALEHILDMMRLCQSSNLTTRDTYRARVVSPFGPRSGVLRLHQVVGHHGAKKPLLLGQYGPTVSKCARRRCFRSCRALYRRTARSNPRPSHHTPQNPPPHRPPIARAHSPRSRSPRPVRDS